MKRLEGFAKNTKDRLLGLLWAQWARIGLGTDAAPYRGAIIDPEALIVSTCSMGRFDPRLFDEMVDWMSVNSRAVSLSRLKSIAGEAPERTRLVLGAVLAYLTELGVRGYKTKGFACESPSEKEALFAGVDGEGAAAPRVPEEIFARWGILRVGLELRGLSKRPDPTAAENLRFKLRGFFGPVTRAEVVCYMLYHEVANSSEIARAVNHNQAQVHSVLRDLVSAGMIEQHGAGKASAFVMDGSRYRSFFAADPDTAYYNWAGVYRALETVTLDRYRNTEEYGSDYLAAARAWELTETASERFYACGIRKPRPEFSADSPEGGLEDYISGVLHLLGA